MLNFKPYITSSIILTVAICVTTNPIGTEHKLLVINPQDSVDTYHKPANFTNIPRLDRHHSNLNKFYKRIYIPGEPEWNADRRMSNPKYNEHYGNTRIHLKPERKNIIYSSLIDPLETSLLSPQKNIVYKRRLLGNVNPLDNHLAKLKQVGADNKPHNLVLPKSALRSHGFGDEYIYIRNPVEIGVPRAVMTIDQLKDIMSRNVLPKNREWPTDLGIKKDMNQPAILRRPPLLKIKKRKPKNLRNIKTSKRLSKIKDKILQKIITNNRDDNYKTGGANAMSVNFSKQKDAKRHIAHSETNTNKQPSDRLSLKNKTIVLQKDGFKKGSTLDLNRPQLKLVNNQNLPQTNVSDKKLKNTLKSILQRAVSDLPKQLKVTATKNGSETTPGPVNVTETDIYLKTSNSMSTIINEPITTVTQAETTVEVTTKPPLDRPRVFFDGGFGE